MKKILILGVNGFIGHHLSKRILETTSWEVYGMDMQNDRIGDLLGVSGHGERAERDRSRRCHLCHRSKRPLAQIASPPWRSSPGSLRSRNRAKV